MPRMPRLRLRRGLTILEITVVLSIIGVLCAMAAAVFPGPMQYYRARRSMESMLWDLRKIQQFARSRGHASVASTEPALFGMWFYQGTVRFDGASLVKDTTGYSYMPFGPVLLPPPNDIAGLNPVEMSKVVNLDASLIPVDLGGINAAPRALPKRIQFAADITTGLGDVVPDNGSPMGSGLPGSPNFMDFLLQNNDGYFRLEIDNQRFIGLRYVPL